MKKLLIPTTFDMMRHNLFKPPKMKRGGGLAVCLLSGGLDSTTALYVARRDGYKVLALTIEYGQIHQRELESAKRIAHHLQIEHHIISISLPWGGSALVDRSIPLPINRGADQIPNEIPLTYVPARNTIFLAFAASFAEARCVGSIFIGANALDYSGYPDCRPEYFERLERALELGTKWGAEGKHFQIHAPLIQLKKSQIVSLARELGVPVEWTWSCYKGEDTPCGICDSCLLRQRGFEEAGIEDPLISQASK